VSPCPAGDRHHLIGSPSIRGSDRLLILIDGWARGAGDVALGGQMEAVSGQIDAQIWSWTQRPGALMTTWCGGGYPHRTIAVMTATAREPTGHPGFLENLSDCQLQSDFERYGAN
jgi:hypothetical protein